MDLLRTRKLPELALLETTKKLVAASVSEDRKAGLDSDLENEGNEESEDQIPDDEQQSCKIEDTQNSSSELRKSNRKRKERKRSQSPNEGLTEHRRNKVRKSKRRQLEGKLFAVMFLIVAEEKIQELTEENQKLKEGNFLRL